MVFIVLDKAGAGVVLQKAVFVRMHQLDRADAAIRAGKSVALNRGIGILGFPFRIKGDGVEQN